MKTFTALSIIILLSFEGLHAQNTQKQDLIFKKNNTILEASIDTIYAGVIHYKLFSQPGGSMRRLNLTEVSKIKFSDGTTSEITNGIMSSGLEVAIDSMPMSRETAKKQAEKEVISSKKESEIITETRKSTPKEPEKSNVLVEKNAVETNSSKQPRSEPTKPFHMLSTGIGGEFIYYPGFVNKSWSNKGSGFALDYAYGGSIRVDFRPVEFAALSITAGYSSFELERRFKPEQDLTLETLYSENQTFTQVPLSAGLKFFVKNKYYVMPQAGISLVKTKVETSADHPSPDVKESYNTKPVNYGLGAGIEVDTKGAIFFDLSFRYQYLDVKDFNVTSLSQSYSKPLSSISFRVGIGFRSK